MSRVRLVLTLDEREAEAAWHDLVARRFYGANELSPRQHRNPSTMLPKTSNNTACVMKIGGGRP